MSDGATEMLREEGERRITLTNPSILPKVSESYEPKFFPKMATPSVFDKQVGGEHYKTMKIQPLEFAIANDLDFFQKDIIKYVTRRKGGKLKRIEDLHKAKHYLEMYIEAISDGRFD